MGKLIRGNDMTLKNHFADAAISMLIALIFSAAWSLIILTNLAATFSWPSLILTQLSVMLLWTLIWRVPRISASIFLTFSLLAIISYFSLFKWLEPLRQFVMHLITQLSNSVLWSFEATQAQISQPSLYVLFIAILTASLSYLIIWRKPLPFLLLGLMLFPLFGASDSASKNPENIVAVILCLSAVGVTFSRFAHLRFDKKTAFSFPPLILIAILLLSSYSLHSVLPENFFKQAQLADRFRQLKKRWGAPETVNYYEFSLRDAGYYPMDKMLGGPLNLEHEAYMQVSGPLQSIYLRGAISTEYNGRSWEGQLMEPNYIFDNEARHGKQGEVFAYPEASSGGEKWNDVFFSDAVLTIEPLQIPVQVIFNGGKPLEIINRDNTKEESVYYFNDGGQIYAGEEISSLGYQVVGYIPRNLKIQEKEDLLIAGLESGEIQIKASEGEQVYAEIVRNSDPELYELVYLNEANTVRDKVKKLFSVQKYLQENYRYEVEVSYPDINRDFLEWFLQEKEGYCVYFGTAMTLLAREMGFDARYVEGFVVPKQDDTAGSDEGKRVILGDSAHAWTEIKFEGLGWLIFDATPSDALGNIRNEKEGEGEELTSQESKTEESTPPSTTQTSEKESMSKRQDDNSQTSQTRPSQANKPTNKKEQNKDQSKPLSKEVRRLLYAIVLLILMLLAFLFFYLNRRKLWKTRHSREMWLDKAKQSPKEAMSSIWGDIKHLYYLSGNEALAPQLTPLSKFIILHNRLFEGSLESEANAFIDQMEKLNFADKSLNEQEWMMVLNYYEAVEQRVKEILPKQKWLKERFFFPGKTGRI